MNLANAAAVAPQPGSDIPGLGATVADLEAHFGSAPVDAGGQLAHGTFDSTSAPFVPRLTFFADSRMRLQAQIGPNSVDEIVNVDVKSVRPDVFLVAWSESSGNYVVQLHDYQNGVVHNRAHLADGTVFEVEGSIRSV